MTGRAKKILSDVLELTERERAELAQEILASLDGPADDAADELWAREIERRIADSKADPSLGEPWATVKARIEKRLWGSKTES